jgi:cytochrome c oxidase cbb3-type subunit 3
MVPWGAVLGEQGVANVASYVLALSGGGTEEHLGKTQYEMFCVACHGPTGDGNPVFGAPSLNDDVWLYGGSVDAVTESIANGRSGEMPGFDGRLDDVQIRLLVALLTSK